MYTSASERDVSIVQKALRGIKCCVHDNDMEACKRCPYDLGSDIRSGSACIDRLLDDCGTLILNLEQDLRS